MDTKVKHERGPNWGDGSYAGPQCACGKRYTTVKNLKEHLDEMNKAPVRVTWYEHDCEYISKYCDEHHTKSAQIPLSVLQQYQNA